MDIRVDRKSAIKKLKSLVITQKNGIETFRAKLEKKWASDFVPNRVEKAEQKINGVVCDILSPEVFASKRILIYVHGGSFVGGSRDSWRSFCSIIANATSSRVIVPEFRLSPSYPFPYSLEDIEKVLNAILDAENHSEIIIAGDGSGANLATALMFKLDTTERKKISKLILFSPWLDLTTKTLSNKKLSDEVLSNEDLRYAADLYTYSSNLENILVSPLRATEKDFENFPEVYIQCGGKELLLSQAEQFYDMLDCYKIRVTLDVIPNMMFMFQFADDLLMESHVAVEKIGKYLNQNSKLSTKEKDERTKLMKANNILVD